MGLILERLRESEGKGKLLEKVIERALQDLGFQNVRRQLSGSQFGFDIVALRKSESREPGEVWKFECKNIKAPITVHDIAPKLIWNFGQSVIDRFVIVSTSEPNNDLHQLLSNHSFSMPIVLWVAEGLENIISVSAAAMQLLGLPYDAGSSSGEIKFEPIIYPPPTLTFDAFHELDPPFRFDYLYREQELMKAYTGDEFRLIATLTNNRNQNADCHALEVITSQFEPVVGRVLRLVKMKGLYKPVELRFSPSPVAGGYVNILGSQVWRIEAKAQELIRLMLRKDARPGFYRIIFRARCNTENKKIDLFSPSFLLRVRDPKEDVLTLHVFRHYDSAVRHVLNLDEATWRELKRRTSAGTSIVFLGPSLIEISRRVTDSTWIIREIPGTPSDDGRGLSFSSGQPSQILLDLKVPVEEELYSVSHAIERMAGQAEWQTILPRQMERRRRID